MTTNTPGCRHRQPTSKEQSLAKADFDLMELECLALIRQQLAELAWVERCLQTRGSAEWTRAHKTQSDLAVTLGVARLLDTIRQSRTSTFVFSNPACPCCAAIVTEHEQRIINALSAARSDRRNRAVLEMMMLCEGNDIDPVMQSLDALALVLGPREPSYLIDQMERG
jgi:hypothetical protein